MKKLINKPENVVMEMLEGLAAARSDLKLVAEHKLLVHSDIASIREKQVVLISGGGSGHDSLIKGLRPVHAGYIGIGGLSCVVCGEVFSSPTQDAVLAAIRLCAGPHGVLLIVKNYTGDKLNFKLAAEIAKTQYSINVETVVIGDDVSLLPDEPSHEASQPASVGARGLAGVVLLHKIVGAFAATGAPLCQVAELARRVASSISTMGVGLTPCTVPALGRPTFSLADDEMEVGLGIHGEHGAYKQKLTTADNVTDKLIAKILKHLPAPHNNENNRQNVPVVVLLNNLGSLTHMELAIVARRTLHVLTESNFEIKRVYAGTYLTALEMSGVSISIMPVDDNLLSLLDALTTAPAWIRSVEPPHLHDFRLDVSPQVEVASSISAKKHSDDNALARTIRSTIEAVCNCLVYQASYLNELDAQVGDGDLGTSLALGANNVLNSLDSLDFADVSSTFQQVALLLRKSMGGSSGPLFSMFFLRFSQALHQAEPTQPNTWIQAFERGIEGIEYLGESAQGDRTMLDALHPALQAMKQLAHGDSSPREIITAAYNAAEHGAEATKGMKAKRGRSSYLQERVLGHLDPGAKAIALIFKAIADKL